MVGTSELCCAISIKALDLRAAEGQVAVDDTALLLLSHPCPAHVTLSPCPRTCFSFTFTSTSTTSCVGMSWRRSPLSQIFRKLSKEEVGREYSCSDWRQGQDPLCLQCCLGFALNIF